MSGLTQAAQGISFDAMVAHQAAVAAVLQKDPNVDSFMSAIGFGAGNTGRIFIRLKPRDQRRLRRTSGYSRCAASWRR